MKNNNRTFKKSWVYRYATQEELVLACLAFITLLVVASADVLLKQ